MSGNRGRPVKSSQVTTPNENKSVVGAQACAGHLLGGHVPHFAPVDPRDRGSLLFAEMGETEVNDAHAARERHMDVGWGNVPVYQAQSRVVVGVVETRSHFRRQKQGNVQRHARPGFGAPIPDLSQCSPPQVFHGHVGLVVGQSESKT